VKGVWRRAERGDIAVAMAAGKRGEGGICTRERSVRERMRRGN